jgi:hypothetical protein
MMSQLEGKGTVQIRYINHGAQGEIGEKDGLVESVSEPYSSLHNKMYISENAVLIDCQHPGDVFMYYVYGSCIMLDDKTVRNYYDNYFNALWSTASINLSVTDATTGPIVQTPYWNTYPIIDAKNGYGDFQDDNWFERKGNLLLCNDDIQEDAAPFSSCCGGVSTNNLTPRVSYEIIFSDPNIMNHLDNSHPKLFFNWWYNQINECNSGDFIYLASGPFVNLGSLGSFRGGYNRQSTDTTFDFKTCQGQCIGYDEDAKTQALNDLNQKFNAAYKQALDKGVTIYICAWTKANYNSALFLYNELHDYNSEQVKLYNSPIFWHCKIYATPYAAYTGSQNALLPDSYEVGFAFYQNVGQGYINPLYYETLKVCQQFVNIEAGYKELKYNMDNPLEANWVNVNDNSCDYCSSFLSISPGNSGPTRMSDSKYATTGFGDKTTTESETMIEIAQNANEYLNICCYDMGYTGTFPENSSIYWKEGSPVYEVIKAAKRGVKVKIILSRQGMAARINKYKNNNDESLLQFVKDVLASPNIELYVQDPTCLTQFNHILNSTRKCHMAHCKFFVSESSLYNSSSNFDLNYLDGSTRNSGVYTTNQHCIAEVLQFFNWILTVKDSSQGSCIKRINNLKDLSDCAPFCDARGDPNSADYKAAQAACSVNAAVDTGTFPVFKVDQANINVGQCDQLGAIFYEKILKKKSTPIILLAASVLCVGAILYYKSRKKKSRRR